MLVFMKMKSWTKVLLTLIYLSPCLRISKSPQQFFQEVCCLGVTAKMLCHKRKKKHHYIYL